MDEKRGRKMVRHIDDLDLVALIRGLRPNQDPLARHLRRCVHCQERQALLQQTLDGWEPQSMPTPRLTLTDRPVHVRTMGNSWTKLAGVLGGILILLFVWPKLIWPENAPWGPTGTLVLATGHIATLTPDHARHGQVQLHWSTQGWAMLTARNLPNLSRDKVYEVWWILGKSHVRAATFQPDNKGQVKIWLFSPRHFLGVNGIGITEEHSPGSNHPTGPREFYGFL